YRQREGGAIMDEAHLQILFKALLLAQLPLYGHGPVPFHILADISEHEQGVLIHLRSPVSDPNTLMLHTIAAITRTLSYMWYRIDGDALRVEQYDGDRRYSFPVPRLVLHDDGVVISNWTEKQLRQFFTVTEFPEQYYFNEENWKTFCCPGQPGHIQKRWQAIARSYTATPESADEGRRYLSPSVLRLLLDNPKPITITAAAWSSFDYHCQHLPRRLLPRLRERAALEVDGLIPERLKAFLACQEQESEATPRSAVPQGGSEEPDMAWMREMILQKTTLNKDELNWLESMVDSFSLRDLQEIVHRIQLDVPWPTRDYWENLVKVRASRETKHNPLLRGFSDEVLAVILGSFEDDCSSGWLDTDTGWQDELQE
ncbi:MAG: hypothetical protein MI749_19285, partial [Desulfovibrionales bacterium]|nr:hypothetical protein [Desulfovibrionales bacterium]